jgi:hypothetical protein
MTRGRAVPGRYKPVVVPQFRKFLSPSHPNQSLSPHRSQSRLASQPRTISVSLRLPLISPILIADMPASARCKVDDCDEWALTGRDVCAEHL